MDTGLLILLALTLGTIMLLIQRTEQKRRLGVSIFMLLIAGAVVWFVSLRQAWGEALLALVLAGVFNLLFWVLIGRYNPVGSSDSIRVLGMDD